MCCPPCFRAVRTGFIPRFALSPQPGRKQRRCCETKVRFKRLSREDIESYLKSDEWRGNAGGYAIQGLAEAFVRYLTGSYISVMGFHSTKPCICWKARAIRCFIPG